MKKAYFQCFWRFYRKYFAKHLLGCFGVIAGSLLGLATPYIMKLIIDDAIGAKNLPLLYTLLGISLGILLLQIVVTCFRNYMFTYVNNCMLYDVRMDFYGKVLSSDVYFFQKKKVGELMSRLMNELPNVVGMFNQTLVNIISEVASLGIVVAIMFTLNVQLALISLISIPLIVITYRYFNPRLRNLNQQNMEKFSETNQILQENFQSISTLKNFKMESYARRRFARVLQEHIAVSFKIFYLNLLNNQIMAVIYAVAPTILILYGGILVFREQMTVGSFVAFYSYIGVMYGPVRKLSDINVQMQNALVALQRFAEMDQSFVRERNRKQRRLSRLQQGIKIQNLTFGHREGVSLIDQFNLQIPVGSMIGIQGRNGIGKSTLFHLIINNLPPGEGQIYFDGISVDQLCIRDLRQLIGVVPQDVFLFNETILENICLGRTVPLEKIYNIAKILDIHDYILSLPAGYNTMVEKQGDNFSGGQKQKIALIRALVHDPQVILLDEATTALDQESECKLFEYLLNIKEERVILYITHQEKLLQYADSRYVFADSELKALNEQVV